MTIIKCTLKFDELTDKSKRKKLRYCFQQDVSYEEFMNTWYRLTGIDSSRLELKVYTIDNNEKFEVLDINDLYFLFATGPEYVHFVGEIVSKHSKFVSESQESQPALGTQGLDHSSSGEEEYVENEEEDDVENDEDELVSDSEEEKDDSEEEDLVENVVRNVTALESDYVPQMICYSGTQFAYNPEQQYWQLPRADTYHFEPDVIRESTVRESTVYKYAVYNNKEEMQNIFWTYALEKKWNLRVKKSATTRYEVGCKLVNCNFVFRARSNDNTNLWHVTEFISEHSCDPDIYGSHYRNVKATTIASLYSDQLYFRKVRPLEIIEEMKSNHGVDILYGKARKAAILAKQITYGCPVESYSMLPSYFHMVGVSNPHSVTAIKTDEEDRFMYSFMALGPSIDGFKRFIRPTIALDATHLKGEFTGVVMSAVAQDGNDHIYPIAFGWADGEKKKSWTWFVRRLREAIGVSQGLMFVSDRHKSIKYALKKVYPEVPHGYCFYHIKGNLSTRGIRKSVLELFRLAAYSYSKHGCDRFLEQIRLSSTKAYEMLMKMGKERWARAYSPRRRYSLITSNIVESMNNRLKKARKIPITSAHEVIRLLLQGWFSTRRNMALASTSVLTESANQHIFEQDQVSNDCRVHPVDHQHVFLVKNNKKGDGQVDLRKWSCSCGVWTLSQLPCFHVLTVARHLRTQYNAFCNNYYTTEWWLGAYNQTINPLLQMKDWDVPEEVRSRIVLPPVGSRLPGRPREKRIPSTGEFKKTKKCGKCSRVGHNRSTCTHSRYFEIGESSTRGVDAEDDEQPQPSKKTCSICHEHGHNRRSCTLLAADSYSDTSAEF